jgi:glutamate synthase (NADPH/NADH) small chain
LGIAGEELFGVTNALDLIAGYKSGALTMVPERVVVVGAGNTAIDAAIAAVRLGSTDVHIVYRRGPEQMSAFAFEYEHARNEGVKFLWHVQPIRIYGGKSVERIELTKLAAMEDGSIVPEIGSEFSLETDLVVLSIGQGTHAGFLAESGAKNAKIELERGRIVIDRVTGQTSHPKFFAGGDCTNGGREVVDAVADGKRAGIGIAAWLEGHHVQA